LIKIDVDFTFNGLNLDMGIDDADTSWLNHTIIKKKSTHYINVRNDAGNLSDKKKDHAFFYYLAIHASRLIPSGIDLLDRYKHGSLKTK
jgi:hypothetical protein